MYHGQGMAGQAETVWACTTSSRGWLCQANLRGRRSLTLEQRKTEKIWINVIKYSVEDLRLNLKDVENRAKWKKRTRVAVPSPRGIQNSLNERERVVCVCTVYDCSITWYQKRRCRWKCWPSCQLSWYWCISCTSSMFTMMYLSLFLSSWTPSSYSQLHSRGNN